MAAFSIRNIDDDVKERLRVRAAQHERSMEAEIRAILIEAVAPHSAGLFGTILGRFSEIGGTDLDLPPRNVPPRAASLQR